MPPVLILERGMDIHKNAEKAENLLFFLKSVTTVMIIYQDINE